MLSPIWLIRLICSNISTNPQMSCCNVRKLISYVLKLLISTETIQNNSVTQILETLVYECSCYNDLFVRCKSTSFWALRDLYVLISQWEELGTYYTVQHIYTWKQLSWRNWSKKFAKIYLQRSTGSCSNIYWPVPISVMKWSHCSNIERCKQRQSEFPVVRIPCSSLISCFMFVFTSIVQYNMLHDYLCKVLYKLFHINYFSLRLYISL
jgi:hypothetical protein